jgi:hypothetical protein
MNASLLGSNGHAPRNVIAGADAPDPQETCAS